MCNSGEHWRGVLMDMESDRRYSEMFANRCEFFAAEFRSILSLKSHELRASEFKNAKTDFLAWCADMVDYFGGMHECRRKN